MNIENLRQFVEAARAGSFSAAGRHAGADPSAVSRAVSRLEAEIGARLFNRTTRSMSLTDAGETLLERAEALIEAHDAALEAVGDISRSVSGLVRITASVGFAQHCLVPLIPELHRLHPGLRIDLVATDANLDLAAEGVDLAIRLAPRPEGDYVTAKLRDTRYRVVAAPDFATAAKITRPADVSDHDCLCFRLPGFRSQWRFRDRRGNEQAVAVSGGLETTSSLAILAWALEGLGPALLADWLVDEEIARGRLVDLFPDYEATATSFDTGAWLLYPSRRFLPRKTRTVIDFLKHRLAG